MISYDCVDELNAIANHPEIYPGHLLEGFDGPIDCSEHFQRGAFGAIGEGYGFIVVPVVPGVYEIHASIMPDYRNKSIEITLSCMGDIFTQTAALELVCRNQNNPLSKTLAMSVGMRKTFERSNYEYFSIHISQWAANAKQYIPVGRPFTEDDNHAQYLGIALMMTEAELTSKAVWFYNLWAQLADFPQYDMRSLTR